MHASVHFLHPLHLSKSITKTHFLFPVSDDFVVRPAISSALMGESVSRTADNARPAAAEPAPVRSSRLETLTFLTRLERKWGAGGGSTRRPFSGEALPSILQPRHPALSGSLPSLRGQDRTATWPRRMPFHTRT